MAQIFVSCSPVGSGVVWRSSGAVSKPDTSSRRSRALPGTAASSPWDVGSGPDLAEAGETSNRRWLRCSGAALPPGCARRDPAGPRRARGATPAAGGVAGGGRGGRSPAGPGCGGGRFPENTVNMSASRAAAPAGRGAGPAGRAGRDGTRAPPAERGRFKRPPGAAASPCPPRRRAMPAAP